MLDLSNFEAITHLSGEPFLSKNKENAPRGRICERSIIALIAFTSADQWGGGMGKVSGGRMRERLRRYFQISE